MTYPPDVHLLRDLDIRGTRQADLTTSRIPVRSGVLDSRGVRLGVMATLVDVTGASLALAAVRPDWIATADLSVHVLRPVDSGTLEARCRLLRMGSRNVVVDATLVDDDGNPCGSGRIAFARIPGSATAASMGATAADAEPVTFSIDSGVPLVDSILDLCGLQTVGPGKLVFEKAEYIRNSFGTVNGGVLALAAEAAAASASGGGDARDLHIHYLEQTQTGPVAVTAEVTRAGRDDDLCLVRIEDRSDGRLVAIADVTVGRPDAR